MKYKITLKNILFFILIIGFLFTTSCKDDEPVESADIEKVLSVVDAIDEIHNTVRLDDSDYIEECLRQYEELNDSEKALVDNYDKLDAAVKKITYLKGENTEIENMYTKVKTYVETLVPENIVGSVYELDIPSDYKITNEYDTYTFRIRVVSSDTSVINNSYEVFHGRVAKEVTLKFTISNSKIKNELVFERKVNVEKSIMKNLSNKQVVMAYLYGAPRTFTEIDFKNIDIVNICFAQVRENDGHFYVDPSNVAALSYVPYLTNRGIRVVLSLGGWQEGGDPWAPYQNAAKTAASRKELAESILSVLQEYNLDGIDMDWEYPRDVDKDNYTLLMKQIKDTLKAANINYLVTAAIPAGTWVDSRYDLASLNNVFDYINLMAYDMDGDRTTGFHCALFDSPYSYCNGNLAVEYFHSKGVDYKKIVLGMAFYGRLFKGVTDGSNSGLGASFESKQSIPYNEIRSEYLSREGKGVTSYYNAEWGTNYLYDSENNVFICYDGKEATYAKCDYCVSKGLGGLMYWAFNEDADDELMSYINDKYDDFNKTK